MSTDSDIENSNALSEMLVSQTVYHPDFDREVYMVTFSVDGQGFKTDSSRLTLHSEFLRDMLYNAQNNFLGGMREGSTENPIVVHGCTKEAFANFMSWLNHNSWERPEITDVRGYIDVLHLTHMWEMQGGFRFAVKSLEDLHIRPAHKLFLARRYGIPTWIPMVVRVLLTTPFDSYTREDYVHIGFDTFTRIAIGKETISHIRRQLAFIAPYPNSLDNAPHCTEPDVCKRVWSEYWAKDMLRRIHHPVSHFPLSSCLATLRCMDHKGMHNSCKEFVLDWMETSCPGLEKEEKAIRKVIVDIEQDNYAHRI